MREKFSLIAEDFQDVLTPSLRPRKVTAPLLDGSIDYGAVAYEERRLAVRCATASLLSRGACRELSYAVSRKAQIVRWDEPDKYYVGRAYDPADIERIAGCARRFVIVFTCEPFAYGNQVTETFVGSKRLTYAGTARTPARIVITASGATTGLTIIMREGTNL